MRAASFSLINTDQTACEIQGMCTCTNIYTVVLVSPKIQTTVQKIPHKSQIRTSIMHAIFARVQFSAAADKCLCI